MEEGKGVDEEVSLLPDAEREISDADKERAILAKEAAEKESESETASTTAELTEDNEDEAGEKAGESRTDADDQDGGVIASGSGSDLLLSLNQNEIRELDAEECYEKTCQVCKKSTLCKYALLATLLPTDGADVDTTRSEIQYICGSDCVAQFRTTIESYTLTAKKLPIQMTIDTVDRCLACNQEKPCKFRIINESGLVSFICSDECVDNLLFESPGKYVVKKKRFLVEELPSETDGEERCIQCTDMKKCKFSFKHDNDSLFVCHSSCLNLLLAEQPDRFRTRRQSVRVRELPKRAVAERLIEAHDASVAATSNSDKVVARTDEEIKMAAIDRDASFIRRCGQCFTEIVFSVHTLQWETMDFCNEACLGQYQRSIGAACTTCQNAVSITSLGKYCVRFGYEVRQFCRSACLDVYKKDLKVCSYCQRDISKNAGFLAPIGGQFKDFCAKQCMKLYEQICHPKKKPPNAMCAVCNHMNPAKIEFNIDGNTISFCTKPCFSAFQFVNNIVPGKIPHFLQNCGLFSVLKPFQLFHCRLVHDV